MRDVFYPPPSVQGSIPPFVRTPIRNAPPGPDNPPLLSHVYKDIIAQSWQPEPLYTGNFVRPKIPIIPLDTTGDSASIKRENTLSLISQSWYTPYISHKVYMGRGPIAPFLRSPDDPPNRLLSYPYNTYIQYENNYKWSSVNHKPIQYKLLTPGIIPVIPSTTFEVNVNIYSVRHVIEIDINNNKAVDDVNQGSTFIFTIHALHRKGFPKNINTVNAVSISLKDPSGNVVVLGAATTKNEDSTFSYIYQLDTNAAKGPWSVQTIASYATDVSVTPYAIAFVVI